MSAGQTDAEGIMESFLLLAAAAFFAGIMNAIAGGGTFLTFPALIFVGVPSVVANASNTVALFPGMSVSIWTLRNEFSRIKDVPFRWMLTVSLLGGSIGALLLLLTPERIFSQAVPWLLLLATFLFTFGPKFAPHLQSLFRIGPRTLVLGQFVIAIYGGYFGGAIGILMFALYTLCGLDDMKQMNAIRALLAGAMNGIAVLWFILAGHIAWPETLVMIGGAMVGGYIGGRGSLLMNPKHVRVAAVTISIAITAAFFIR